MECGLPAPTVRFFRGETGIFMPTFVEELVGTVGEIAPCQCGDRIDDGCEIALARLQSLFRTCVGDSKRGLIRKQTEPGELSWTEWVPAEDRDNPKQFVSKDERVTCKTANVL